MAIGENAHCERFEMISKSSAADTQSLCMRHMITKIDRQKCRKRKLNIKYSLKVDYLSVFLFVKVTRSNEIFQDTNDLGLNSDPFASDIKVSIMTLTFRG